MTLGWNLAGIDIPCLAPFFSGTPLPVVAFTTASSSSSSPTAVRDRDQQFFSGPPPSNDQKRERKEGTSKSHFNNELSRQRHASLNRTAGFVSPAREER